MKSAKIRELTKNSINDKLTKLINELSELKFDLKIGKEKDYSKVKKLKLVIARIKTIIKEDSFSKNEEEVKTKKSTSEKKVNNK